MFTHQVRKRLFRLQPGAKLDFPAPAVVSFFLGPPEPFGMGNAAGRTTMRGVAGHLYFDSNTGKHYMQQEEALTPLKAILEDSDALRVKIDGNELRIEAVSQSLDELAALVETVRFGLPLLLNLHYIDSPLVERVEGTVGGVPYRWELDGWNARFETTTQEEQQDSAIISWRRLRLFADSHGPRVMAALHYFHVACRLERAGNSPWEFMAEVIVNQSKVLEALFPPGGDGRTRDAARRGLQALGYVDADIEKYFIPAMALRNKIDSGHVDLSLFTREQLEVVHRYTEVAESAFRHLLRRVVEKVEEGSISLPSVSDREPDKETLQILERLSAFYPGHDAAIFRLSDAEAE
jgi:hypothetical protein